MQMPLIVWHDSISEGSDRAYGRVCRRPAEAIAEAERFAQGDAFIDALKIPATFRTYYAHYRIDLDPR
jgi:hypothetical protein